MEKDNQSFKQFISECTARGNERMTEWRKYLDIDSWTFDGKNGLLNFQLREGLTISYPAQIVGSWNAETGTFLWSWANSSIPDSLSAASAFVHTIGEKKDWPLLSAAKLECDEECATALAYAASELTNLPICYKVQASENLYLFFIFQNKQSDDLQTEEGDEETSANSDETSEEDEEKTFGDFTYYVCEEGAVITQYEGEDSEVVIPETFDGTPVVEIGEDVFNGNETIERVVVSEGIQRIGDSAFQDCPSLQEIQLPESLTDIGYMAFAACTSLTSVVIPNGVTTLGEGAFEECENLESAVISNNIEILYSGTFNECSSLETIDLPESLTELEDGVFGSCSSLKKVFIPKNVCAIGDRAFSFCSSLQEIVVDEENETFKSIDGVLFSRDGKKLVAYPGGKSNVYNIPNGTEVVGSNAFGGNNLLTSISIPETVVEIEEAAFFSCTKLVSAILPTDLERLGAMAFHRCSSLKEMKIPGKVRKICDYTFDGCTQLCAVSFSENEIEFGKQVFGKCENATIYAKENSSVQAYAQQESIPFVAIN